jgi:probable F420-dependent oxidoreductase
MKVRIGVAVGGSAGLSPTRLPAVIDDLDRLGFDSIWLPETLLAPSFDALVGLAFAAARVSRLKLGTHLVVPGRNPVRLARALAELDQLSGGRLLLTAVLGLDDRAERAAQGLPEGDRGALVEDVLPLMRRLWAGDTVDASFGPIRLSGARLPHLPLQDPLEVWLGGQSPRALRRAGRLGDGWLPGIIPIDAAVAGRAVVEDEANAHGRRISPEHFGTNISYAHAPLPDAARAALAARSRTFDATTLVPVGRSSLRDRIGAWVDAGFSKLVVRPALPPDDWHREIDVLADAVLDLQT